MYYINHIHYMYHICAYMVSHLVMCIYSDGHYTQIHITVSTQHVYPISLDYIDCNGIINQLRGAYKGVYCICV